MNQTVSIKQWLSNCGMLHKTIVLKRVLSPASNSDKTQLNQLIKIFGNVQAGVLDDSPPAIIQLFCIIFIQNNINIVFHLEFHIYFFQSIYDFNKALYLRL